MISARMLNRLRPGQLPPNMKLFLLNVFAFGAAVEGIPTVLLNLYLLRLGYGTEFIGTLNSAGLFVFALVSLPIGAVQRYSSRQLLLFGQILAILGLVATGLALFFPPEIQPPLLIGARILTMVGLSAYFVHQLPYALEITRPSWHSKALSITMAVLSLATFSGSWLGGVLPNWFGALLQLPVSDPRPYMLPMLVAAAMIVPAFIAVWLIPYDANGGPAGEDESEGRPPSVLHASWRAIAGLATVILLVRALQVSGVGVVQTFANVYFDEALQVPTGQIGLATGIGRLLGVPMSLIIPWLVGRYGNFNLVHISLGLIILMILPLALIPVWPVAALAFIAINGMATLRYLSFIAFTIALVSDKQRSLMSGIGEMAIGAGFAVASFLGGYLIAWYGYRELFLYGAGMTALGAFLFWLLFRKRAAALRAATGSA